MRSMLGAVLLAVVSVATTAANEETGSAAAPAPASFSGELAFTDTIVFDYDRDGTPDRVQFWIDLKGLQAIGTAGDPGFRAESGSVSYFVFDVERQQRIDDWLLGFNMGGGFPVAGEPYPITNISVTGRTVRFDLSGSTWTVTDAGDSWEKDAIEIDTGGRVRKGRFYGGDIRVTPGPPVAAQATDAASGERPPQTRADAGELEAPPPATAVAKPAEVTTTAGDAQARVDGGARKPAPAPKVILPPADIKENRRCVNCHAAAAGTIAAHGGAHGELSCVSCHNKHPRDVEGAKPLCLNCHNSHSESITMRMCSSCHSSHDVAIIRYGIEVPDAHCAACHKSSARRLRESGTRHTGLACVLCHRSYHGTMPTCVDCHGGPHAKRVMSKPDRCVNCHEGAHQTKVDR